MVAAFFYMYFVGAGIALGVGSVALVGYKLLPRIQGKNKKRKGVAF